MYLQVKVGKMIDPNEEKKDRRGTVGTGYLCGHLNQRLEPAGEGPQQKDATVVNPQTCKEDREAD